MRKVSKFRKSVVMVAMAAMLSLTGLGVSGKSAKADTIDTTWSFSLAANSYSFNFLPLRQKDNSTKIYFNWNGTYGGTLTALTVSPYGAYDANGSKIAAGTNSAGEKTYSVNQTGKYRVTNYVHELGMTHATLGVRSKVGYGTAKGVWSPDCAGSYSVLQ